MYLAICATTSFPKHARNIPFPVLSLYAFLFSSYAIETLCVTHMRFFLHLFKPVLQPGECYELRFFFKNNYKIPSVSRISL